MGTPSKFDVIVVGSGIAGSALAIALSRAKCSTLVVERGKHPRFAIGESSVPTQNVMWRQLAESLDVPEFRDLTSYLGLKVRSLTGWPKCHFHFCWHDPGSRPGAGDEFMLETPRPPVGPDVHLLRQDSDEFLVRHFDKYGVTYLDETEISDVRYHDDSVELELKTPSETVSARATYVIDASGHASAFANQLGLREDPPQLLTNSRSLFCHFSGVRTLEELLKPSSGFRFVRQAGTGHHVFDGGWIWVIPFDNDVCSVGVLLDNQRFPLDPSVSAEAEFQELVRRFPVVAEQLADAKPVRKLIRTGRIQFRCSRILSHRVILAPHAAGFIDPLYSTGITLTLAFISRIVPAIRSALDDADPSMERFEPIDRAFRQEVDVIDQMVSGSYRTFRTRDLYKQFWRVWIEATFIQFLACRELGPTARDGGSFLYGACVSSFRRRLDAVTGILERHPDPHVAAIELARYLDSGPAVIDADLTLDKNWSVPGSTEEWAGAIMQECRSLGSLSPVQPELAPTPAMRAMYSDTARVRELAALVLNPAAPELADGWRDVLGPVSP